MRSLVGPVPEPAERASSALRRCARATLSLPAPTAGSRGNATPAVALAHRTSGTADLSLVIPTADAAAIPSGGVHARLEVLDEILGGAARGRCRRLVVVDGLVEQIDTRAQRHAATRIARDLPDSALLGVGSE